MYLLVARYSMENSCSSDINPAFSFRCCCRSWCVWFRYCARIEATLRAISYVRRDSVFPGRRCYRTVRAASLATGRPFHLQTLGVMIPSGTSHKSKASNIGNSNRRNLSSGGSYQEKEAVNNYQDAPFSICMCVFFLLVFHTIGRAAKVLRAPHN